MATGRAWPKIVTRCLGSVVGRPAYRYAEAGAALCDLGSQR